MSGSIDRRLMELVESALDLPEAERLPFLEGSCRGDGELFRRARGLLDAAAEPVREGVGGRIEELIGAVAASVVDVKPSYPQRIGPYKIRGVLGEGGMGMVLAAHQEEPVSRDVALKLIRPGIHAPRIVARFHAERQTLASVEHPNIAKLYDAGTTPEGLPYFVMELIVGEPLTEYCDRRRLGLDERLGLFRTLLGAVQHAHQKTIVHRDLKPSNVLVADVDGRSVLKVIDFGIARVASPEPGVTRLTGVGVGPGTLEYMSPEQVLQSAHGADTRSDVYSLGVLLYELVSGRLPFEPAALRGASPSELERMLLHTPVPRASRRTTSDVAGQHEWAAQRAADARTLEGRIRGDLETIIEVAMAGDPARRYPTVARLDDDLALFLEERPITARPSTLGYRAGKFVARNRYAVAGSAVALSLVVGAGAVFTVRLAAERDRSEVEALKAMQVAGFLQSLFEAPNPTTRQTADLSARELLDSGSVRIEAELADQPEVQSALFGVVGRTYAGLGLWDESTVYLSKAIEVERATRGPQTVEAGNLLHALGAMSGDAGRWEEAEAALRQALEIRTPLLGRRHPETAATLAQLSLVARARGEYSSAEALALEAVSSLRAASDADSLDLAVALHALAFAYDSQAFYSEAEPLYREAIEIRRRLLDPTHPTVLSTAMSLALLVEQRGDYEESELLLRDVLERRRERLGPDHPLTLNALSNLAYMTWRSGDYPRATDLFEEAVQLGERINPGDNPTLAITLNNLGVAQRRIGAYAESEGSHRRSLAMNRRLFDAPHPIIAGDMDNLGRTLLELGRAEEAESLHVAALAMRDQLVDANHPDRAGTLSALAMARIALGRGADGIALLEEALRALTATYGAEHPRTGEALHALGVAHLETGALGDAETRLREALRVRRAVLDSAHPDIAATLTELGRLLREASRPAEARAVLAEALAIARERLASSDPQRTRIEREIEALPSLESGGA